MINIILNAAADHLVKLSVSVFVIGYLLYYYKDSYMKYLKIIKVPAQFLPVVMFLGKYKVDILLVILLLLISLAYTKDMNFEKPARKKEAELIIETFDGEI